MHDYEPRRVRDLPILGAYTTLLLARRRLACPQCGPKLEHLSWLAPLQDDYDWRNGRRRFVGELEAIQWVG